MAIERVTYIPGPITITNYYDADGFTYPVGAIYMSTSSTSPATLFGGSWEQIQGRFLAACDTNGQSGAAALNLTAAATGGATTHTVTTAQLPSHSHTPTLTLATTQFEVRTAEDPNRVVYASTRTTFSHATGAHNWHEKAHKPSGGGSAASDVATVQPKISVALNNTGSGTAYSTMPPYLAVYMWKRTE